MPAYDILVNYWPIFFAIFTLGGGAVQFKHHDGRLKALEDARDERAKEFKAMSDSVLVMNENIKTIKENQQGMSEQLNEYIKAVPSTILSDAIYVREETEKRINKMGKALRKEIRNSK